MTSEAAVVMAASASGGRFTETLIFLALIFGIFWFLIIRPQNKRQRERREMIDRLRKNDHVVTAGGVHGVIVSLKDEDVLLRVDPQQDVTLRVTRSSISRVLSQEEGQEGKE